MSQYSVQYDGIAQNQINLVLQILPETLHSKDIYDMP